MTRKRVTAKLRLRPDPILTQVCEPVEDGEDVSGVIRDMMYILTNSKTGVGLAAPQAGHLKRIILVSANGFPKAMINPEFSYYSGVKIEEEEQCLSYPGEKKDIWRYGQIKVKYWKPLCNKMFIEDFFDFKSRIIQHEIDHLNGKCLVGEQT